MSHCMIGAWWVLNRNEQSNESSQKLNDYLGVQTLAIKLRWFASTINRRNMCHVCEQIIREPASAFSNKHAVDSHPYPRGENFPIIGLASVESARARAARSNGPRVNNVAQSQWGRKRNYNNLCVCLRVAACGAFCHVQRGPLLLAE